MSGAVWAEVPISINYQGRLLDGAGIPISSNVTVDVAIYTNQVGGAPVYTEGILGAVAVNNGMYSLSIEGAGMGTHRLLRGGSSVSNLSNLRCARRSSSGSPTSIDISVGFRCVRGI